ncbi:hypothetical protein [Pseudoalteromonas sp. G4]|uniref:hypothetical protein n=1 Tax=Pseudoalteromonas sp. G4 TaxID=2992761 RepID=UPI00237D3DC5|nr:hypothetical protein [Pseudoalteromonas sp. G4]MDE3271115.1 hypothetical protein [Pseudoalteromonas sp. G4]
MTNSQNAELIENAYHAHDISKLESKSNIAVADYVEITEKQKEIKIIAKYDLFSEIEEV